MIVGFRVFVLSSYSLLVVIDVWKLNGTKTSSDIIFGYFMDVVYFCFWLGLIAIVRVLYLGHL
jgi:hypothetical protein